MQAVVQASGLMSDDPIGFYNLEEVEDLARKVLPKAVSTSVLPEGLCYAFSRLQTINRFKSILFRRYMITLPLDQTQTQHCVTIDKLIKGSVLFQESWSMSQRLT